MELWYVLTRLFTSIQSLVALFRACGFQKRQIDPSVGQLQMYVNYYDRFEKLPDENDTVGILLCACKNDTVVKLALREDNRTILASQYQLYLPTTDELIKEINDVKQLSKEKDC